MRCLGVTYVSKFSITYRHESCKTHDVKLPPQYNHDPQQIGYSQWSPLVTTMSMQLDGSLESTDVDEVLANCRTRSRFHRLYIQKKEPHIVASTGAHEPSRQNKIMPYQAIFRLEEKADERDDVDQAHCQVRLQNYKYPD